MADEDDPMVTISGPALALLLYENARTTDQIGFLLGEVLIYVTKKVTDTERDVELTKFHINIKGLVAYPISEPFFNSNSEIDENKLSNFLMENKKKVVGWYHYRDEFPLRSTLRDHKLHNELSKFFYGFNKMLWQQNFIFCLLNSSQTETGGTHKFKQLLMRKKRNCSNFSAVSLKINNLGADATRPDGSDYKLTPKYSSCESDSFEKVYRLISKDLENAGSDVQAVKLIQMTAEQQLNKLIHEVEKSDKKISQLESQLERLREQKHHQIYEKTMLEFQMRQMEVDTDKCDARSDSKTPDLFPNNRSPNIFEDSPERQIPSGSNVKLPTFKTLNQDLNITHRNWSSNSPDREYLNHTHNRTSTYSTSGFKGSPNDRLFVPSTSSSSGSGPNTLERNNSRSSKHKTDSLTESSSGSTPKYSQYGRRSLQQSSDHDSNDDL